MTPVSQGVGDRPYPGAYITVEALLRKLGPDDYQKLFTGKLSFADPRVVEVLKWVKELADAGAYPKNFMTLKLGESHYVVGFELLKYGDRWEVITQTSSLAGMPGTGVARPISPEEFDAQTSE